MSTELRPVTEPGKNTLRRFVLGVLLVSFCMYTLGCYRDLLNNFVSSATAEIFQDFALNVTRDDSSVVDTAEETTAKTVMNDTTDADSISIQPATVGNTTATKSTTATTNNGGAFVKYDKVVIVTKIHGVHQIELLEQSICLLHFAYNRRVLYDIVVFYAEDNIPAEKKEALKALISPAKISFVLDNPGLQEMIQSLTPRRRELFFNRCNTTDPAEISFWSNCPGRIAYNWQAEFRSVHIWKHPALQQYKYMLWLDSDGFCSEPWEQDPIHFFIQQQQQDKAVILFDNFPRGTVKKISALESILEAFGNVTVASLRLDKQKGHLVRDLVNKEKFEALQNKRRLFVPNIHGFMHITDLDFFRQPKVWNGLRSLLGDCFMCRNPDDQLAVTIAPAIFAPEKALDMRSNNITLNVFHNFMLDGAFAVRPHRFNKYWKEKAKNHFPEIVDKTCRTDQGSR